MSLFHRKKNTTPKKTNQFRHSRRRARERYHIDLTESLHRKIVKEIQSNKALFIRRESLRVSAWVVEVEEKKCLVLYDCNRKSLITFLPREKKYNRLLGTELNCGFNCRYCNSELNKEEEYARRKAESGTSSS